MMGISVRDQVLEGVVTAVLAVVGVLGNSVTLWAIGRSRKLRHQPTTILMLALITADLLFCGAVLPFISQSRLDCWFCSMDSGFCRVFGFVTYWNISVVLSLQAALAINRWVVVCGWVKVRLTPWFSVKAIGVATFLPAALLSIPLARLWGDIGWDTPTESCTIIIGGHSGSSRRWLLSIGFGLPFFLIFLCYFHIIKTIRRSRHLMELRMVPPFQGVLACSVSPTRLEPLPAIAPSIPPAKLVPPLPDVLSVTVSPSTVDTLFTLPSLPSASVCCGKVGAPPLVANSTFAVEPLVVKEKKRLTYRQRRLHQERVVTLTVGAICGSYIFCLLPALVILLIDPQAQHFPEIHTPAYVLAWMSCVINPLVYVTCNPAYREAFRIAFKPIANLPVARL